MSLFIKFLATLDEEKRARMREDWARTAQRIKEERMNLDETLAERGARYGAFKDHADVAMALKGVVAGALAMRNKVLANDQQQALDTIFDKVARIVNGDPDYADNWHDIAGYATLVEKRLTRE